METTSTQSSPMHTQGFLSRAFPVPHFLTMSAVGLDISYQSVRCFELVPKGAGYSVGMYTKALVPANALYADEPHTNGELVKALQTLRKEQGIRFVHCSLPDDKSFVFRATFPVQSKAAMRAAIESELEQHIPLSGIEAVFDFTILPTVGADGIHDAADGGTDMAEGEADVVVCAFPRKSIEDFILLYEAAGMVPMAFSTSADAVARALVRKGDQGAYMIVNFGAAQTGISIVADGVVQFTSTLNFGGKALTTAIEKQFSLSTAQAEEVKTGKRILQNKQNMELFYSLMNPISALKDEMNRILLYWKNYKTKNPRVKTIEKVILCGGDSTLPGIDEYLSISLKLPVDVGNVWVNICDIEKELPTIQYHEALSAAAVIGLALR